MGTMGHAASAVGNTEGLAIGCYVDAPGLLYEFLSFIIKASANKNAILIFAFQTPQHFTYG